MIFTGESVFQVWVSKRKYNCTLKTIEEKNRPWSNEHSSLSLVLWQGVGKNLKLQDSLSKAHCGSTSPFYSVACVECSCCCFCF